MRGKRVFQAAVVAVVLLMAVFVPNARAGLVYSGSLSGNADNTDGIIATDGWKSTDTVFLWTVTEVGTQGGLVLWEYDYTFTVPRKDISHLIIEVSPDVVEGDFSEFVPARGILDIYSDGGQGNSNPNMPGEMKGLKFELGSGSTYILQFKTTRAPVWGDFYAKDGKDGGQDVTAWNAGFISADPVAGPANGSLNYHILRPDTEGKLVTGIVPEPATLMLLGLGLLGLAVGQRGKETLTKE